MEERQGGAERLQEQDQEFREYRGENKVEYLRAGVRQILLLHVLQVDCSSKMLNDNAHLLYLLCGSGTGAVSGFSLRFGAGSGSCLYCWEVKVCRIEKHLFLYYLTSYSIRKTI